MLRVFEYSPNLWQTTIEKDMPNCREFIKGAWDNRTSEKSYIKILRAAKGKSRLTSNWSRPPMSCAIVSPQRAAQSERS